MESCFHSELSVNTPNYLLRFDLPFSFQDQQIYVSYSGKMTKVVSDFRFRCFLYPLGPDSVLQKLKKKKKTFEEHLKKYPYLSFVPKILELLFCTLASFPYELAGRAVKYHNTISAVSGNKTLCITVNMSLVELQGI